MTIVSFAVMAMAKRLSPEASPVSVEKSIDDAPALATAVVALTQVGPANATGYLPPVMGAYAPPAVTVNAVMVMAWAAAMTTLSSVMSPPPPVAVIVP